MYPCSNCTCISMSNDTTINQWLQMVHIKQKERQFKKPSPPSKTCSFYAPAKRLYKCKWGSCCFQGQCPYVHPTQDQYPIATFYKNLTPCRYETADTICRQKCGRQNGRYCPFQHCRHVLQSVTVCDNEDCQGHCRLCVL